MFSIDTEAKEQRRTSISKKMYLFIVLTVLAVALGTAGIAYFISADQIDNYFKRLAENSAENFASFVDADFYARLREVAESEEFQELREQAEENDDEEAISDYLEEKGLWEEYQEAQAFLNKYLENMDDIRYLYVIVVGDSNAEQDMYLMDSYEEPIYQTGYWEDREAELIHIDGRTKIEATISNGDWGWLCSAYYPVYDDKGRFVCNIGCDVSMENVINERYRFLAYVAVSALIFTSLVLAGAIYFTNKILIKPLGKLTAETKKFKPSENTSYEKAGVVDIELKNRDEISDIYQVIRSMQINIIDYLNDLSSMQKDNERVMSSLKKAEDDIKDKEEQLGQISKEAYRDPLTNVGNKAAYVKRSEELTRCIAEGSTEFALIMIDLNDLKMINDRFGHRTGDQYIKGCCGIITEVFENSPVFRIGGDEFIIAVDGTDFENRHELLAKLKEAFDTSSTDERTPQHQRYSAAVGMAEYASDDNTVELVFKRADKEMYADKMRYKQKNGSYR